MKIHIKGMDQIGDSIYSRQFVNRLLVEGHDVYITTAYPKFYQWWPAPTGTGAIQTKTLHFVQPYSFTRKAAKMSFVESQLLPDLEYLSEVPSGIEKEIDFHYNGTDLKTHGIVGSIEKRFGFEAGSTVFSDIVNDWFKFGINTDHRVKLPKDKKIAVVRPVTSRKEFPAPTRSPEPHYIGWIARTLRNNGYHVISIADIDEADEFLVGSAPPADQTFHRGELGLDGALSLMQSADLVVGGSGFMIPACLTMEIPMFIVFGGRGEYDNPQKVLDLRYDLRRVGWALPDNFCRCNKNEHDCDKTIRNLDDKFFSFMRTL